MGKLSGTTVGLFVVIPERFLAEFWLGSGWGCDGDTYLSSVQTSQVPTLMFAFGVQTEQHKYINTNVAECSTEHLNVPHTQDNRPQTDPGQTTQQVPD